MKRGTTVFLKIAVFLIGITVLALCIFWLPWLANDTAEMFPEFAFLQYPVLIGLYVTVIPFFLALYQALKLLNYIENNNAFSELSVKVLKYIKYCAITISILYLIGTIVLMSQNALHPGIAIIGLTIIFTSVVIAVFTAVLQKLLKNVLDIKSENDFTV
ncbi:MULTISPECIES: DUF2975 domain-containing protein [Bacillaceae]|uniref:DUF2975 domain-containing protein n=5 Tax=Bacillus cereus group TaxID=86661 RepID=A0A6I6YVN7_9BACI|nr:MULTISPECIES: DUF2975 domain-containing protein [Bacillaceae]ACJ82745.1 YoaS [Bacillus cereus AH187]EEK97369.1 hypothetical protein bcere0013_54930 [Bacillus cereus BDRD-ST26]EEL78765.1 hypothetical protein bcere0028_56460 [Bacillus cereus AH1271]EEL84525.1 hypothetical protein bcere0029_57630 [Bacillus cereus AH1272]EEL90413.1 hypothetical protein bcere0030_56440 [Bacillus cereus AH1273]EJP86924.1 hypothetical protein IAU_04465 [Bacillus cereus IS075]EJP98336.1 hypothetical protein IC5_0